MDFVFCHKKNQPLEFQVKYIEDLYQQKPEPEKLIIEKLKHLDYVETDNGNLSILLGDVIQYNSRDHLKDKGFFYRVEYCELNNRLEIHSDYHSFLPIFYLETDDTIVISSSAHYLYKLADKKSFNAEFAIDMALFNVPLCDTCFYKEVKRLQFGEYALIDNTGCRNCVERRFYELFVDNPRSIKSSISEVAGTFIRNCKYYLDQPVYIALTGGFDGRTINSVAHYYQVDYKSYTFGKKGNSDVDVPLNVSSKLGFPHILVELGDEFIANYHAQSVRDFLRLSGGMNGFLYSPSILGIRQLSHHIRPVLTGYCGSELLRNAHFGGAISSQAVIDTIGMGSEIAINNVIANSDYDPMQVIPNWYTVMNDRMHHLAAVIWEYPSELSKNQQLATFEFEEIIPKLFGTWVYVGMHYTKVRVPYMDTEFLGFMSQTKVSQFYRKFMEKNPVRRFDGQLLYARIMDKTWPALNRQMSNKGYAPADLLSISGMARIICGYMGKKKRKESLSFDNLGLISGALRKIENGGYDDVIHSKFMSDLNKLYSNEHLRDMHFLMMSVIEYCNTNN